MHSSKCTQLMIKEHLNIKICLLSWSMCYRTLISSLAACTSRPKQISQACSFGSLCLCSLVFVDPGRSVSFPCTAVCFLLTQLLLFSSPQPVPQPSGAGVGRVQGASECRPLGASCAVPRAFSQPQVPHAFPTPSTLRYVEPHRVSPGKSRTVRRTWARTSQQSG